MVIRVSFELCAAHPGVLGKFTKAAPLGAVPLPAHHHHHHGDRTHERMFDRCPCGPVWLKVLGFTQPRNVAINLRSMSTNCQRNIVCIEQTPNAARIKQQRLALTIDRIRGSVRVFL